MPRQLFRQEAIDAQREKYLGEAIIARPVPFWVFTALAVGIAILLVSVALWGQYQRRERVDGFLALDQGAARVLISDAGRVNELLIKEGDVIVAGAPMAKVSIERLTASGASSGEAVAKEMESRRASLEKEQSQWKELGDQQVEQVRRKVKDLENELVQVDREMKLQETRVASTKEQANRYKSLAGEKFVSDVAAKQKQDEVTDQEIKLQALRRQRSQVERDLGAAKMEEPSIRLRTRTQADQVSRQMSELKEGLANVEARRENVIRAPVSGVVTNIAVTLGQSVASDATLATVLPTGSGLHVELLVPTRAIGFVQKGQEVVLRYEAFPFERFGQYRGTIADIGRNVWSAGEKIGPLAAKEPVYRVDVKLDRQDVAALGQTFALRPGMLVNADLLLEKRTLIEWLFEPILQLKSRL
ncbi:HlyD family efflux transporter periplasmic adaptor subunit [Usitatibacter palustris]|uniref:Colicin V secretion protein CvaA n=1 Tax=Usitatibacter palustris TaxID=2732487 RepID=A0A6M4H625_9PROT|nr:HlyD family efflux transporter periplasmic adaptor subunit [Usitatibacter palustris]QJR15101.1 Colicin V secretion protein CvaA [Usitatibacter palustris]